MNKYELMQRQWLFMAENDLINGITPGSFVRALFYAIMHADSGNLCLLSEGFPEYVNMYTAWRTGVGMENYPILDAYLKERDKDIAA